MQQGLAKESNNSKLIDYNNNNNKSSHRTSLENVVIMIMHNLSSTAVVQYSHKCMGNIFMLSFIFFLCSDLISFYFKHMSYITAVHHVHETCP